MAIMPNSIHCYTVTPVFVVLACLLTSVLAVTANTTVPTAAPTRGPTGVVTTTRPGEPTTGAPVTVRPAPLGVGNWTIKDANGTVCMQMSFSAQMNITYVKTDQTEGNVVVNVLPASADLVSNCSASSPTRSLTIYPFTKLETGWTFWLTFKRQSNAYSMTEVGASWTYDSRFIDSAIPGWSSESRGQDNFLDQQVALGNAYTCDDPLTIKIEQATIRLSNVQLQPFAEQAGGKFGKAEPCATGLSQTIIIIIAVAAGVVLLAIIIAVVIVTRKLKKKYSTLENE